MVRQVVNSNPNSPAISGAAIAGIVSGALVASFVAACEAFTRPAIAKRFSQAVDYPQAVHPTDACILYDFTPFPIIKALGLTLQAQG